MCRCPPRTSALALAGKSGLRAVRRTCEALGVTVWQVHCDEELGPTVGHVAANLRWVDVAEAVGARVLVTHANGDADYRDEAGRRRCLGVNRDCLRAVATRAGERGLRVAIENRLERPRATCRRFGARMQDLLDLIDAAGVCLDTSHTRVSRLSFADEIARAGPRLLAAQIPDSDGETQHRLPFTLDIDWAEVVRACKARGTPGFLPSMSDAGADRPVSPMRCWPACASDSASSSARRDKPLPGACNKSPSCTTIRYARRSRRTLSLSGRPESRGMP